jgi:hypothetical protein
MVAAPEGHAHRRRTACAPHAHRMRTACAPRRMHADMDAHWV